MTATHHLGTSGWSYPGWKGRFYPPELPSSEWLSYYSGRFSTVEINMTFYRFPKRETLRGWLERTPAHFTFTLKANRRITHLKKLRDVQSEVRYFTLLADSLREKLGCLLFQLPPSIKKDLELLDKFLLTLSPEHKNIVEFRDESWYDESVVERLRARNVTFCTVSSAQVPDTLMESSNVAYFRFHGLTGGHRHKYSDEELTQWAERISWAKAEERFVYFNNDYQAYAIDNCLKLAELLKDLDEGRQSLIKE
jgi:uncharacterized protein YecE (DUF72 family)